MTSTAHRTGTDRLAEVAARIDAGIIVNIQGDEPLIEPATVEAAIAPLLADPTLEMSTTSAISMPSLETRSARAPERGCAAASRS